MLICYRCYNAEIDEEFVGLISWFEEDEIFLGNNRANTPELLEYAYISCCLRTEFFLYDTQ